MLFGFSTAGSAGFSTWQVWIPLLVRAAALFLFIRRQLILPKPILKFRVFQSKTYTISTVLSVLVYALMIGSQILLTFYVQNVRGMTALETGLMLLPGAILTGIMSPVTGKIFDKIGGRWLAIVGFVFIVLGNSIYAFISLDTSTYVIAGMFSFISLGIAMIMMPLTTAGMNALPMQHMAHGTAVNNTLRMVGGAIITALLVTVMSSTMANYSQLPPQAAMLHGIQIAFRVASALSITGFILAIFYKEGNQSGLIQNPAPSPR